MTPLNYITWPPYALSKLQPKLLDHHRPQVRWNLMSHWQRREPDGPKKSYNFEQRIVYLSFCLDCFYGLVQCLGDHSAPRVRQYLLQQSSHKGWDANWKTLKFSVTLTTLSTPIPSQLAPWWVWRFHIDLECLHSLSMTIEGSVLLFILVTLTIL